MVLEKRTGYVDAQEAARMLGVNQRAVRNLVARRRLESKRDEGVGCTAPGLRHLRGEAALGAVAGEYRLVRERENNERLSDS
jgi:hypothetical protein